VAKRLDSPYRPGTRTDAWRKLRFGRAGDFVVIGWEAAHDHPGTLSSLHLATADGEQLRYAGKVGSGLTGRVASALKGELTERATPEVIGDPPPRSPGRTVHWVQPTHIVEVAFADRTTDGRLRHPVLRGVRRDKTVEEATGDG